MIMPFNDNVIEATLVAIMKLTIKSHRKVTKKEYKSDSLYIFMNIFCIKKSWRNM